MSQNSPSVGSPAESDTPICNHSIITPDEAWAFAYQANLSPDDFEEVDFEEVVEIEETLHETEEAVIAFSRDDTPDIGAEFTTSGTDKADWRKKRRASDVQPMEYLI